MYHSAITASFSAAHALRNYQGKCERLHGHNWKIEVLTRTGNLDEAGMGLDFTVLRERLGAVLAALDHRFLNDLEPFQACSTSSELIARHIFERLAPAVDDGRVRLVAVKVWESEGSWAEYRP
jgi:6-pyruvoyltetrahydropterin/6-carboxytetrahydropterin synthase